MKNFIISILTITMLFSMVSCASITSKYESDEYAKTWVEKHTSKELPKAYVDDISYVVNSLPVEYKKILFKQRVKFGELTDKTKLDNNILGTTYWHKDQNGILSFEIKLRTKDRNFRGTFRQKTIYHELAHLFNLCLNFQEARNDFHGSDWKHIMNDMLSKSDSLSSNTAFVNMIYENLSNYPDSGN